MTGEDIGRAVVQTVNVQFGKESLKVWEGAVLETLACQLADSFEPLQPNASGRPGTVALDFPSPFVLALCYLWWDKLSLQKGICTQNQPKKVVFHFHCDHRLEMWDFCNTCWASSLHNLHLHHSLKEAVDSFKFLNNKSEEVEVQASAMILQCFSDGPCFEPWALRSILLSRVKISQQSVTVQKQVAPNFAPNKPSGSWEPGKWAWGASLLI